MPKTTLGFALQLPPYSIQTCCILVALFSWVMAIPVATFTFLHFHCYSTWASSGFILQHSYEILHCCTETWIAFPWLQRKFLPVQVIVSFLLELGASSLGQMKSFAWLSGTASRRGPGSTVPCSFVAKHGGRTLKEQLLHLILLVFTQCSPLAIHLLTAAGVCSAVSSLHSVNCYHEHSKTISGAADDLISLDGLTRYQIAVVKIHTFEWWKLKVNLVLDFLAVVDVQLTQQFNGWDRALSWPKHYQYGKQKTACSQPQLSFPVRHSVLLGSGRQPAARCCAAPNNTVKKHKLTQPLTPLLTFPVALWEGKFA